MKKILPLLLLMLIIVLLDQFITTYAIFESDVETNTEVEIADWQILVNNISLDETEKQFTIDNILWNSNSNVLPGKSAPGLSGYFEILIDPAGTEVELDYEIMIDFESLLNDRIYLISIKDSDNNDLVSLGNQTYGSSILLSEILLEETETIKVSFIWEQDDANSDVDSESVNNLNSNLTIPVTLKIFQKIN